MRKSVFYLIRLFFKHKIKQVCSIFMGKLALLQIRPPNGFILLCSHYDIMLFVVSSEQKWCCDSYTFVATYHERILHLCFSTVSSHVTMESL